MVVGENLVLPGRHRLGETFELGYLSVDAVLLEDHETAAGVGHAVGCVHLAQRDGHMAEFIFVERGRRLGPTRIQRGQRDAVAVAGLTGADGQPLRVVAHQLRRTWATELANAGMSLQR